MVTWLQHCNGDIHKMDQQKSSQGLMNVISEHRSCMSLCVRALVITLRVMRINSRLNEVTLMNAACIQLSVSSSVWWHSRPCIFTSVKCTGLCGAYMVKNWADLQSDILFTLAYMYMDKLCCTALNLLFFFFFFLGGRDIHYINATITTSKKCDVHCKPWSLS